MSYSRGFTVPSRIRKYLRTNLQARQADGEDVKQSSHLLDINLRHFLMRLPRLHVLQLQPFLCRMAIARRGGFGDGTKPTKMSNEAAAHPFSRILSPICIPATALPPLLRNETMALERKLVFDLN
jgi:hypothetical protein